MSIATARTHRNREPHAVKEEQQIKTPFFTKANAAAVQRKPEPFFSTSAGLVQAKLTIGQPGDKYEQEADAVADAVVSQSASGAGAGIAQRKEISGIQRATLASPAEDEKLLSTAEGRMEKDKLIQNKPIEEEEPVQMKAKEEEEPVQMMAEEEEEPIQAKSDGGAAASAALSSQLSSTKGKGRALSPKTRGEMESAIGADFSGVNVHTDNEAVGMNQALRAQAFTNGSDVYFNAGKYQPESTEGKRLLAHELTHVVQQGAGDEKVQRRLIVSGGNEATVREYLELVGTAAGFFLNWAFANPRVTVRSNRPGGATSADGRSNLRRVINHPTQNAELHIGTNQPRVAVGAFPGAGSTIQNIDMDDIRNLNISLPGQGTAKAFHEMMENFNAHGTTGFGNFPANHQVGLEAESDVLESLGIQGRRLTGGLPNTVIPAPAGQPTGTNIRYERSLQVFTHYFLELIFRRTLGSPTGPGADFEIVSARRIPKVQVSQNTIGNFPTGSAAIPPAGNPTLALSLADLNANPNSTLLIEGFTDNVGRADINRRAGANRANSARAFFIANGINANRIAVVGRGEINPIAPNNTQAGRALNRRVVLTVHRP